MLVVLLNVVADVEMVVKFHAQALAMLIVEEHVNWVVIQVVVSVVEVLVLAIVKHPV